MQRIIRFTVAALALLLTGSLLPTALRAQPNPAPSLVGQSITVCKGDYRFRVAIVSADWRSTISDRPARPGSMWAVAVADLTNLGPDYGYPQGLVSVLDDRGRFSSWALFDGADYYVEDETAYEYDVTPSWAGAEAGATTRTVLIFLVASDATALTMVPNDIGCSGDIVATTSAAPGRTAPAPPLAPSAPAPSGGSAQRTPASSLTGQSVTACKGAERYRFAVVSADWRTTISDRTAPAGMMWAAAVADVTNLSSGYGYFQGLVGVRDDRGRLFDWELFNGAEIYVEDEIAYEYDLLPSWAGAEAGATVRIVIPFLVASDATALTMVPNNIGCGGDIVATTSAAPGSAAPATTARAIEWGYAPEEHRGRLGQRFAYVCPPNGTVVTVWGTDVYTDDSSLCTAAVHAGLITLAGGGTVTIEMEEGRPEYTGSTRNGVATLDYGSFGGSFRFVR